MRQNVIFLWFFNFNQIKYTLITVNRLYGIMNWFIIVMICVIECCNIIIIYTKPNNQNKKYAHFQGFDQKWSRLIANLCCFPAVGFTAIKIPSIIFVSTTQFIRTSHLKNERTRGIVWNCNILRFFQLIYSTLSCRYLHFFIKLR